VVDGEYTYVVASFLLLYDFKFVAFSNAEASVAIAAPAISALLKIKKTHPKMKKSQDDTTTKALSQKAQQKKLKVADNCSKLATDSSAKPLYRTSCRNAPK
jgi:hypothetical protein